MLIASNVAERLTFPTTTEFPVMAPALTKIVTSSLEDEAPSLPVNRSPYVPAAEKLAVVLGALTLPNVTVPGPLNFDHVTVSVLPAGRPSSVAVPVRLAAAGSVMV